MRLLVTRPEPEASELARRLRALGHAVLVQPLLEIVWAAEPAGIARPAAIAVTSRNAVRAVARWQTAKDWRDVPLYAVGGATAQEAREAGFATVKTAAGDGEKLAALVAADFVPARGVVLYPAARDRTTDLARLLPSFRVQTIEAYRAEAAAALDPEVAAAVRVGAIDAVLLFSRRTAETFVALVGRAGARSGLAKTRLLALSGEVAEPLRSTGCAVEVAARPEESSLLSLLNPPVAPSP